jgi:hypothetical protein
MGDHVKFDDYVTPNGGAVTDTHSSFIDDFVGKAKQSMPTSDQAIATAGVAAVGVGLWWLTRGKSAAVTGEFKAGAGALRTLEGEVIPDVARPALQANILTDGEAAFKKAMETAKTGYKTDLEAMLKVPGQITTATGEVITAPTAEQLNKAATDLSFKHVPQLGQFLKGTGKISEEQIEAALKIQRAIPKEAPRKLLGEILVENNLAKQADVDLAFARQTEMKKELKNVFEKITSGT